MSQECITSCPRIQTAIDNFPEDAHPGIAMTELLEICEATYDCSGPEAGEVEVVIGFFRRRYETQPGLICGLAK